MKAILRFFRERRAYAMPFYAIVLATVALPLLVLSVDVTRYFYLRTHLQSALDAACEGGAQALDLPHFRSTGEGRINLSQASGYAGREFAASTVENGITKYSPRITGLSLASPRTLRCSASADMVPTFYAGKITASVSTVSDMRVSRR